MEINSVADKVKKGLIEANVAKLHQVGKIAFPHVKQLCYPSESLDGKGGQYFNLTQLLIETKIDEYTRFTSPPSGYLF